MVSPLHFLHFHNVGTNPHASVALSELTVGCVGVTWGSPWNLLELSVVSTE